MQSDAVAILAQALGVSLETITPQTHLATTAEWDSLAHFRIVLSIEEKRGRALDPVEISTLMDLASVEALLGGA